MTREVRLELPRDATAPRRARQLVEEHTGALEGERRDAIALLVSELVTNALLHGEGDIVLTLEPRGQVLRVEICDHGRAHPHVRETAGADGGWGLRLVDAMALRWGLGQDATRVWFEL